MDYAITLVPLLLRDKPDLNTSTASERGPNTNMLKLIKNDYHFTAIAKTREVVGTNRDLVCGSLCSWREQGL